MNLVEALQFWCELEPVEYLEGRELSVIECAVREAIEAHANFFGIGKLGVQNRECITRRSISEIATPGIRIIAVAARAGAASPCRCG